MTSISRKTESASMLIAFDKSDQIPMRSMSICALAIASGLAIVQFFGWDSGEGTTVHILFFLFAAFGPGTIQIIIRKF